MNLSEQILEALPKESKFDSPESYALARWDSVGDSVWDSVKDSVL